MKTELFEQQGKRCLKREDRYENKREIKIYHIQIQIPHNVCGNYVELNCINKIK